MPEGVTSIDDLKVVITASSEQMTAGLEAASSVLARFTQNAEGQVGRFDAAMAKVGGAIKGVHGAITAWTVAATIALNVLDTIREKGDQAAKIAGAEDDWNALKEAFAEILPAIQGIVLQVDTATKQASYLSREMREVGLESSLTSTRLEAGSGVLARITEQLERAAHEARRLTSKDTWTVNTIDAELNRTQEWIDSFRARIDALNQNPASVTWFERLFGKDAHSAVANLTKHLEELEQKLIDLGELRIKTQWSNADVDTSTATATADIEREIDALRLRAATLGMNTAAAAAYIAEEKARRALPADKEMDEDHLRQRLALMTQLHNRITAFAEAKRAADEAERKAERDRQQAEREAERNAKGSASVVSGADRDVANLMRKRQEQAGVNSEMAANLQLERWLEQARSRGVQLSDEQVIQLRALSASYANLSEAMRAQQKINEGVNQVMAVGFRAAETAFDRFTSGAKVKGKELVESLLRDIEKLIFKLLILKPLQDAISGPIASGLGSMFQFRAEGGQVNRGEPYIVGERGPELMIPADYGSIVPNHALRSTSGGSGVAPVVNVNITAPPGTGATETGRREEGGGMSIDIMIEQIEGKIASGVADGTGTLGITMQSTFGLSPATGAR